MLILFPTQLEAEPFLRLCPDADVVISGVGMAATAATLSSLYASGRLQGVECVVLAGIAGAYTDTVARCEVVEVTEECAIELPERFRERYHNEPYFPALRAVSAYTVHTGSTEYRGAEVENMEGATLFAVCQALGVRCSELRAVSNRVGESFASWSVMKATEVLAEQLLKLKNKE